MFSVIMLWSIWDPEMQESPFSFGALTPLVGQEEGYHAFEILLQSPQMFCSWGLGPENVDQTKAECACVCVCVCILT